MKKKTGLVYALTAAMVLSLAAPAALGAQETDQTQLSIAAEQEEAAAGTQSEGEQRLGIDVAMSLTREDELWKEAGMYVLEWDDAVNAKKQEGLASPLTKEAVLAANPEAQVLEKNNAVYYIDHADALGEVKDALDAYRAAYSVLTMMGGNELADLRLWQQMNINDMTIYSFQQISDSTMVLGSTMKIAVRDGRVSAIFSSLDPEAGKEETVVTQSDAEMVVMDTLERKGDDSIVLSESTSRIHYLPTVLADLDLDLADDDPVPEEMRWVVYTENRDDPVYPYTAHYVDLGGHYMDSLAVEDIDSDEALCGFRKQKIFDGMEEDIWTGEIKSTEGEGKEVALPVMRDAEGRLYLGDVIRRIAVADFAKAVYDDSHEFELVQSDEDGSFDNEDLYMYYNYLTAWDFYAEMGWIGPDGQGTDVVILKSLCTSDGTPYENACSIGLVQGFQVFGYTGYASDGTPLSLGHGLDVMAHEYTHTFTSSIMNSNLYENDQGAINEAMSDILGNLVEQISKETDDTLWLLGEKTGNAIRSMSDPVAYQQPSYVWDEFYGPQTDTPSSANDRGGVHINSSLLNQIAAKLCLDYGMTHEDAVRFWIMVSAGLTPKTDYPQICPLLRWAIIESRNADQLDSLNQLIREEHLEREEIPEMLPYDRKIVHLDLPDTEVFEDDNWALMVFQLNKETIENVISTALQLIIQSFDDITDAEKVGLILSDFLNSIHLDGNQIKLDETDTEDSIADAVSEAAVVSISRLLEQSTAWRSSMEEGITFVTDDDPTVYTLININQSGTKINGCAVLIGERWIDLSPFIHMGEGFMDKVENAEKAGDEAGSETESLLDTISSLTPKQWETLFEIALAVKDVVHPDKSDEAVTEEFEYGGLVEDLLDLGLAVLEYSGADEDTKAEGLLFPAQTLELPTQGLEKVELLKE